MGFFGRRLPATSDHNCQLSLAIEPLEDRQMLSVNALMVDAGDALELPDDVKSQLENVATVKKVDADRLADISEIKEEFGEIGGAQKSVNDAVGPGSSKNAPLTSIDAAKENAPTNSKNPLDNQGSLLIGSDRSQVSDDTDDESTWESFTTFLSSLFSSGAGGAGTKTAVGNGAGAASGAALTILTANTDSPESKKNEFLGLRGLIRQGIFGTSNANASSQMPTRYDGRTVNPDDDRPSGTSAFTQEQIDAINALLNGVREDLDASSSKGGPLNANATAEAIVQQLGQWSPEMDSSSSSSSVTQNDHKAIEARVNGIKFAE